jgi:hypothetical protein
MSLLCDFLVTAPQNALEYPNLLMAESPVPPDQFEVVQFKNLTGLELGFLWAHLEHQKWDVKRHKLEHTWHDEEGSAWLERFPDELVRLLARLETPDSLAALWVQHEEIGHDVHDLVSVLDDLKHLAQLAQASQKSLYLWGSL